MVGQRARLQHVVAAQAGHQRIEQPAQFGRRRAGLREQRIALRQAGFHRLHAQRQAAHGRVEAHLVELLAQQLRQMHRVPAGLRQTQRHQRAVHVLAQPVAFVFEHQHAARDASLLRRQPAGQRQQQPLRAGQHPFCRFDAPRQLHPLREGGRRLEPCKPGRRLIVSLIEPRQQCRADAARQPRARQLPHLPQRAAAHALEPARIGQRLQARHGQGIEQTRHAGRLDGAARGPHNAAPRTAQRLPGKPCRALRRGAAAQLRERAELPHPRADGPAQRAVPAEQAQAGGDVEHHGGRFGIRVDRHGRREVEQRQRHVGHQRGFGREIALQLHDLRRQRLHAAAPHAVRHTEGHGRPVGQHHALVRHHRHGQRL
ncbi:hypothetical protein LMG19282_05513 [Cupriavidus campinensis]|nr:hypothetical protein LMG19282_05513 [Cupriavidus campinensis]